MTNFFTAEELKSNYEKFRKLINKSFTGERLEKLNKMYDHFEDRIIYTPASSFEHFHNSFPGGYIDHVLRVTRNALKLYDMYLELGMIEEGEISKESVIFSAIHHDLGKLGSVDADHYLKNDSEWHRKNQGKMYKLNPSNHYMDTHDRTFFHLIHFGIKLTEEEFLGIRLTDGVYDDSSKEYLRQFNKDKALKTMLPHILHQADMMAAKFELQRWKKSSDKSKGTRNPNGRPSTQSKLSNAFTSTETKVNVFDAFKDIVED